MMGRVKRIWSPNHFYHVVCRGNRRDALFKDEIDFKTFLYILEETYQNTPYELISYCLMTNHYHLQIRSSAQSLSKVMALINKRYASYYNTRNRLTGHVFEKRYYDKLIDSTNGLLEVSHYIHLNSIEAHMVTRPEAYVWSSYDYYVSKEIEQTPNYMNINVLPDLFSGSGEEIRRRY